MAAKTKFYWLPFPGCYQCVLTDDDGTELAAGMGPTKAAAQTAAEENLNAR